MLPNMTLLLFTARGTITYKSTQTALSASVAVPGTVVAVGKCQRGLERPEKWPPNIVAHSSPSSQDLSRHSPLVLLLSVEPIQRRTHQQGWDGSEASSRIRHQQVSQYEKCVINSPFLSEFFQTFIPVLEVEPCCDMLWVAWHFNFDIMFKKTKNLIRLFET